MTEVRRLQHQMVGSQVVSPIGSVDRFYLLLLLLLFHVMSNACLLIPIDDGQVYFWRFLPFKHFN